MVACCLLGSCKCHSCPTTRPTRPFWCPLPMAMCSQLHSCVAAFRRTQGHHCPATPHLLAASNCCCRPTATACVCRDRLLWAQVCGGVEAGRQGHQGERGAVGLGGGLPSQQRGSLTSGACLTSAAQKTPPWAAPRLPSLCGTQRGGRPPGRVGHPRPAIASFDSGGCTTSEPATSQPASQACTWQPHNPWFAASTNNPSAGHQRQQAGVRQPGGAAPHDHRHPRPD